MSDKFIPLAEAAEGFGVTTQTIRRWVNAGEVALSKPDGFHALVSVDDLKVKLPHVGKLLDEIERLREQILIVESYLPGN